MLDRLKRRIYDKKNKKFYRDFIGFAINNNAVTIYHSEFIATVHSLLNIDVQDCIGLKDKNGVLAYKGDIVQDSTDQDYIGVIDYCETCVGYRLFLYGEDYEIKQMEYGYDEIPKEKEFECSFCECGILPLESIKDCSIIGNVYENKELLGGE